MVSLIIPAVFIKILKLILNLIILILYRTGFDGRFLGVGGTWNLNEEKNPDAEIVASGVLVGYFLYTLVCLLTYCFKTTDHTRNYVDIGMNFLGTFLFIAVGGTALHYWNGYQNDGHKYQSIPTEKQIGLAVGSLCILSAGLYLIDTAFSVFNYSKQDEREEVRSKFSNSGEKYRS